MFIKPQNSTKETIYGFTMYIPAVGYGVKEDLTADRRPTGKFITEKADVIKRSNKKDEQYWERTPLPDEYKKKRYLEEQRQKKELETKGEITYVDQELEEFRSQEFRRRGRGVWFYNNGVPTYITGLHYFFLNWWQIDVGFPTYRDVDRRSFYMMQYAIEDPDCLGHVEVTGRRAGKSHRSAAWIYEYISRSRNTHGGIQSKTDIDAKKIITTKIVPAWRKLPDFFRPIYDTMGTDNPTTLSFFRTASRGKNAKVFEEGEELESNIDYESRKEEAYDGQPLHRYISDESGKLKDTDIVERHNIVRFCAELSGKYIGKFLYTTTVEDMADGGDKFQDLWNSSDQDDRNEVNRTNSGLYRVFTPADEYEGEFDKFGFTDILSNRERILAERAGNINNKKVYYGLVRKKPLDIFEAFRFTGAETCMYDEGMINERIDTIKHYKNITTRGNLQWVNGDIDTTVEFVPNPKGRWELAWNFPKGGANKVTRRNGRCFPDNDERFGAAGDPFKAKKTMDYRRSMGAAFVERREDPTDNDPTYQDALICQYYGRPATAFLLYEDWIMQCVYFGCKILIESNVDNWIEYFTTRGYDAFLGKLKDETDFGVYADDKSKGEMNLIMESKIANGIEKVFFIKLLQDWLKFDLFNSQKYDLSMAAGWTYYWNKRTKKIEKKKSNVTISSLFNTYSILN